MDLIFESNEGLRFTMKIRYFWTILHVKEKIHHYYGYPIESQVLHFQGELLDNNKGIEFYDILEGSLIDFHVDSCSNDQHGPSLLPTGREESMKVVVVAEPKGRIELMVNPNEKVGVLRMKLSRAKRVMDVWWLGHLGDYLFTHKNLAMVEEQTFSSHDVKHGDTIEIITSPFTGSRWTM